MRLFISNDREECVSRITRIYPIYLSRNGLGSVLDARVHGKGGARVLVVGRTRRRWRRRGRARRPGFRHDVAPHRFGVRRVRPDRRFAEDDVIPVRDVVPPEVGLSHLLRSDGHRRPLPRSPRLRPTGLNVKKA